MTKNDGRQAIVFVIDDDVSVRRALDNLLRSVGLDVRCFASVEDFEKSDLPDIPACLVLDVRMPGMSGLDFQNKLAKSRRPLPIIFITGHGDIPMTVRAMKGGAVEFLSKPFRDQELLDAVRVGLEQAHVGQAESVQRSELERRFSALSPREREVMAHVVTGRLNKQIAADLDVSEITIKVCRGQVMRKMEAATFVELLRMADKLGLTNSHR